MKSGDYDYIVVGAGAGGCTLAARLAEDPDVRVLLLEAGGRGRSLFITMPAGNGFIFGNPRFDWGFHSEPQHELGGRRIYYPRGRGLGGSTIMNGMIYIRGSAADYDAWRQSGLEGWGYADVLPYFRRAEGAAHRDGPYHGRGGPLKTSPAGNHGRLDAIFVAAARQAGLPLNRDFNGPSQRGVGALDVMVHGGRRQSAARAYLRRRANLTVRTGATVSRVLVEQGRARGVMVLEGDREVPIRAAREVALCLGAFGSPQVLMLSGIGPADALLRYGIAVVADVPGVGRDLQDHLNVPVQYGCLDGSLTLARFQRTDRAIGLGLRYLLTHTGPGAAPFWSAAAFKAFADPTPPELQIFFTPMVVTEGADRAGLTLSRLGSAFLARGKVAIDGFQLDINQMRPDARGEVRLRSADPRAAPIIDPRFLTGAKERHELVAGVKVVRDIVAQAAFDGVRGAEIAPGADCRSDAEILEAIRRVATTGHHPVGTCAMGAVVDASLRVRGVDGLRVVDASVIPTQITGNPNAPIVMIAEKAADMIAGRPPLAPETT